MCAKVAGNPQKGGEGSPASLPLLSIRHTSDMPGKLPGGEPAPPSGELPAASRVHVATRGLGAYIHVPFCASRCGYCDFNTYTPSELRRQPPSPSARPSEPQLTTDAADYVDALVAEIAFAGRVLTEHPDASPPLQTVFFGGGTPTLLPASAFERIMTALRQTFGVAPDAEITTEANPESVSPTSLRQLRDAGINRISLGMQSARSHVLAVLERQHTPGRAQQAVAEARAAGFSSINLDLIYGTPGESDDDWRASLAAAIESDVDHVSAYSLIVEDGTRFGRSVSRGLVPAPDDDVLADRYLIAEKMLTEAGLRWYEVSNWARAPRHRCRHNELYWRGENWWGFGPGAHSHVGGVRWWNVKHPHAYAERLQRGVSPAQARETVGPEAATLEEVMLRLRLTEGLPLSRLDDAGRAAAATAVHSGRLDPAAHAAGRAVLTLRGRLLADAVVRDLVF